MSKVVFKLTFKNPNFKDTKSKNVSHVTYIGTRSGVDKTVTLSDLKNELNKDIDDSSSNETYANYINERPNSHGLFGKDGIEDIDEVKEEISNAKSFVWRGIVSIKEDDAKNLGYLNKDKWEDMLRKKIPDMADEMGISVTNLRWVAAVHMAKGHPHAHIMLWEDQPKIAMGIISTKRLNNIRKLYTDEIFSEERQQMLNEKNMLRELLIDTAKKDISNLSFDIKNIDLSTNDKLDNFVSDVILKESDVSISPKLYNDEEMILIDKVKHLAEIMPSNGRIALKFMPEDVKNEVREIADYLLQQPEFSASLEKNLKIVENMAKMYTSDEAINSITRARENAYNDIRDRISQIILRGAAESQRENTFIVDKDLANITVDFIKDLKNKINVIPEQNEVLKKIAYILIKTGHSDEQISNKLSDFINNEHLEYPKEDINKLLNDLRNDIPFKFENNILTTKNTDYYLTALKASGYDEKDSFNIIRNTISNDKIELNNNIKQLVDNGFLKQGHDINVKNGDSIYELTDKGIEEFLKVKNLDNEEKMIINKLGANQDDLDNLPSFSYNDLINDKDVFSSIIDKDPKEFDVGNYDKFILELFEKDKSITFKQLENNIYEKYTEDEKHIDTEKADSEIESVEDRINKLTLNGYINYDKDTKIYTFTEDGYNEISSLKKDMEFTLYDAKVTLSYIDNSKDNVLYASALQDKLEKEITNKTASRLYESFKNLLNDKECSKFINVDGQGNLTIKESGKYLYDSMCKTSKFFFMAQKDKTILNDETLKKYCTSNKQYIFIKNILDNQIKDGYVTKDIKTGAYSINPAIKDINKLIYYLNKENGVINKKDLNSVLNRIVPNKEAKKQYDYLIKRLDFLKRNNYLSGEEGKYKLTSKGIEKRENLLVPQRELLSNKLQYLLKLGLIELSNDGNYKLNNKYFPYINDVRESKKYKFERKSDIFDKKIADIIDRTQNKVNINKIERSVIKNMNGKYINNNFNEIQTDYDSIRSSSKVKDTLTKTLSNLSTVLLVSGNTLEETKDILQQWNVRSNSNIDINKINDIVDKANAIVKENNLWGQTTIISKKEWNDTFKNFNLKDSEIPYWFYKGLNWKDFNRNYGMPSLINSIWKSIWSNLERQRNINANQAEHMKKNLIRQQSISQNKSAIKEQVKKNKDKGVPNMDL